MSRLIEALLRGIIVGGAAGLFAMWGSMVGGPGLAVLMAAVGGWVGVVLVEELV